MASGCKTLLWVVVAVALFLLLLWMNGSFARKPELAAVFLERDVLISSPDDSNPYAVKPAPLPSAPPPIPGPPNPLFPPAYGEPIVGGGCGCGEIQEVSGGSHAGKILSQVEPRVTNHRDLAALAAGGSPRDSAYVCLGGKWHKANNLNAYQGMITGGGPGSANSIRFSNRNAELIMGGAPAAVLSKVHLPVFRSVDTLQRAVRGGVVRPGKYCAAMTGGGKIKWFST